MDNYVHGWLCKILILKNFYDMANVHDTVFKLKCRIQNCTLEKLSLEFMERYFSWNLYEHF